MGDELVLLRAGSGVRSPGDDGWEVIDKADSLQDGSHVGAAVLMRPPSNRLDAVQAESTAESKGKYGIILIFQLSRPFHLLIF